MRFPRITIISLALTVGYYMHIILQTIIKTICNCSAGKLHWTYLHTDSYNLALFIAYYLGTLLYA